MLKLLKSVLKDTIESKLTSKLSNVDNKPVQNTIQKQSNKRKYEELNDSDLDLEIETKNDNNSYSFKKARYPLRNIIKEEATNASKITVENNQNDKLGEGVAIQVAPVIQQIEQNLTYDADADDGSSVSSSSSDEENSIEKKYNNLFKNSSNKQSFIKPKKISQTQLTNTWNEFNKKYYVIQCRFAKIIFHFLFVI